MTTTLTTRTPEDVLAAIPVVLGFQPCDSVVMLTDGGSETFHARVDLPDVADVDQAVSLLLDPARQHGVRRVIFVLYGDDRPASRRLLARLRRAFTRAGISVLQVLRADAGRWYSPGCSLAPAWGVPYDLSSHPFLAQAVADGIVVHGSRAELEALLRPVDHLVAETERAVRRAVPSAAGEVADLVDHRLDTGRFTTAELARVLLAMADRPGRDAAWRAMSRESAQRDVRLWTDAVQRAPAELVAAPAAVLAFAAWLAGHGALAWCAVDRSQAAEPDNSLAGLVADLLERAVAPSTWEQVAG